jgi:hypothetical protein
LATTTNSGGTVTLSWSAGPGSPTSYILEAGSAPDWPISPPMSARPRHSRRLAWPPEPITCEYAAGTRADWCGLDRNHGRNDFDAPKRSFVDERKHRWRPVDRDPGSHRGGQTWSIAGIALRFAQRGWDGQVFVPDSWPGPRIPSRCGNVCGHA